MKNMTNLWNTFFTSGSVEDYLSLKEAERSEQITRKPKNDLADEIRFRQMEKSVNENERLY